MIKFFRKIRQSLLSEGKISKYFKYAIGEIFLVVIGILIALQVSNWNERRKELLGIESLMDKFENDLRLTIWNANHDINNSAEIDTLFKNVLNNEVSKKDYQNDPFLKQLSSWRFTLNPELDNMRKLIENEEVLPTKYNTVIRRINRLSFVIGREHDDMNVLKESSEIASDFINMNYSWARKSDSLSLDEAYNYFLNDESYKNRLFSHWNKAMAYTKTISRFRAESLSILSYLKVIREAYEANDLKLMLEGYEQTPFKLLEPETLLDPASTINISQWPIFINWTNDTVSLKIYTRNGDLINEENLYPKRIRIVRSEDGNLNTDYLRIFETYKNDVLQNKYLEVPNGFLIIE
jgi:hypothetical protein